MIARNGALLGSANHNIGVCVFFFYAVEVVVVFISIFFY